MRVLVVDDEDTVRGVICSMLARSGAEVDPAGTCAEAFGLLDGRRYDWVVLDYHLPDGTGLDILRAARARQPDARAVILTGDPGVEQIREEAVALGAEAVFAKPFCLHELMDLVRLAPGPRSM